MKEKLYLVTLDTTICVTFPVDNQWLLVHEKDIHTYTNGYGIWEITGVKQVKIMMEITDV